MRPFSAGGTPSPTAPPQRRAPPRSAIPHRRLVAGLTSPDNRTRERRTPMQTDPSKATYVRNAGQSRRHTCHWPGCAQQVPPAMWGCKSHWFRLPKHLRNQIWETYEIGQEVDMTPSDAYLDAALAVQVWIDEHAGDRR